MSLDFLAVQKAIRTWAIAGSGLPAAQVYWGQQDSARAPEPAVEMRVFSIDTTGRAWTDVEVNYVTLPTLTVAVVTAPDVFTAVAHGAATGDGPYFAVPGAGPLPLGLAQVTPYWVIRVSDDTFKLAASFMHTGGEFVGGPPPGFPVVPLTVGNVGTTPFTLVSTNKSLKANQELRAVARGIERLVIHFECHTSDAVGMGMAFAILSRIKTRQQLPSQDAILQAAHISLTQVERVRAIHGIRNAVMFEPRAIMEATFSMPTEESEYQQRIERIVIPNGLHGLPSILPAE